MYPGYNPGYWPYPQQCFNYSVSSNPGDNPYPQQHNNCFVPRNPQDNLATGTFVPFKAQDESHFKTFKTRQITRCTETTVPDAIWPDKPTIREKRDCNGCLRLMEQCDILECCKGFMCKYCQDHGKPCQKCSGDTRGDKNKPLRLTEANVNRWNTKAENKAQDDRDWEELKEAIDQYVGIQTEKN